MTRMSFLEHLEELRTRIIQSTIGLVAAYLVCLIFAKDLFSWVRGPIQRSFDLLNEIHGFDPPLYLVAITPQEQFHLIYLKVPLLGAVFVAAPWLVYQVWAFIAPGLYQRERGWAKPFIFCIAGLFILGGLFGYFVVLKFALTFLLGIGIDSEIRPMISVSSYFSTFVMIELGLGIVFQMPVVDLLPDPVAHRQPGVSARQRALRHPDHLRHRGGRDADARRVQYDPVRRADDLAVLRRHRRQLLVGDET